MPAGIPDSGEAPPNGAVRKELVALQLFLEEVLQVRNRGLLIILVEPARLPGLLPGLDDEGRATRGVLIGVGAPEPVGRRLEVEGEGGKGTGATEPDEAVPAPVELRLKPIRQPVADLAGGSVGSDDQIGSGKTAVGKVSDLPLPMNLDPQRLRPPG